MKLSSLEESILAASCFDAERSQADIAAELHTRLHTVQYTISKFKRLGLLQDFVAIDMGAIGLTCYGLYFSLNLSASKREKFVQILLKHPAINFVAEYFGAYQFGCGVLSEHPWQAHAILAEIVQRSGAVVAHKSVTTRWRITETKRKVASDRGVLKTLQFYTPARPLNSLTATDWETLSALSDFPSLSLRDLAQQLQIPFPTLYSRLQRLRQQKILLRRMYLLDVQRLGLSVAKLLFFPRGVNPLMAAKLRQYLLAHPLSQHLVETFGEWDYETNFTCASVEQILRVREEISQQFSSYLERVEVLLMTNSLKRVCFPGVQFAQQLKKLELDIVAGG